MANTPPTVTITSAALATNNATQTITGTVTAGSGAIVGQTVTLTDNGTTLGTAIVQADGSFSVGVVLPNQGANSIVATVSDSYGNTGTSAAVVDTLGNVVSVAPTIIGTTAGQTTTSEAAVHPFSGVTIDDANVGATDTLTITLSGAGGTLSGAGLSGSGNTYTLSGSAATITSQLQALTFTPAAGSPNSSQTTTFTLSDVSSAYTNVVYASTATAVATFNGTTNGNALYGNLIADSAGNLFGTTQSGGANNAGTVFEIVKNGSGYNSTPVTLVSFNGTNGSSLQNSLLMDAAGNLFGTTETGGAYGKGTIFEIVKNGSSYSSTPVVLASFDGTNGNRPPDNLIMDASGNLFGMTYSGGANGGGTVFELVKTGSTYSSTPTTLVSFDSTSGINPAGSLSVDAAGNLYGTTTHGGANNVGTVFEIAKTANGYSSTPTVLVSFNGTNGASPGSGSIIFDAAGNLFGTTQSGGANNAGAVFEIAKTANGYSSTPTVLVSFNGTNGSTPYGNLIMDAHGDLLGTTWHGGANGYGVIYEVVKTSTGYSSTPVVLTSFNGTNANGSTGALLMDGAGNLFGTSPGNTVFELPVASATAVPTVNSTTTVINTDPAIAPTVTITSAAEASNVAAQTITGTVTAGSGAIVGQTVTLTDNGTTLGTAIVQADGSFSATVTLPNQGANSIVATVTDSLGSTGTSAAVVDTLDNIAPTVTITSAAEASNVAAQTITGTVSLDGAAAVVGQTVTVTDNGTTLGTAIVQADGSFSVGVVLPNQGANSIVATVSDSYGNTGTSAAVVDTLDNIAPTVTITSAAEASNVAAQTITGTVSLDGAAAVVGQTVTVTDNGTTLGTAIVQADGSFSVGVVLPNQGANSIVATVSDSYGNTGTSAAVVDTLGNVVSVAPTIIGTTAGQTTTSEAAVHPFSGVTIDDANVGATDTLTITLSGAGGTLSGAGLSGSGNTYTLSGSAATITSQLQALTFTPAAGSPNSSQTTTFTLSDVSSAYTNVVYASTATAVATFNGTTNGNALYGNLIADSAGNLFGTTQSGGANNAGTVFEIVKNGSGYNSTPVTLVSFNGTNGSSLQNSLLMDAAGNLFGTTETGGAYGKGTIFEIVKNGSSYSSTPVVLASFDGTNGNRPPDNLIMDASGNLFGMTYSGGANGGGTVFELVKTGSTYSSTPTTLVSFDSTSGINPAGSLSVDAAGNLYGTTTHGGANNVGTVFEIAKTANGYSSTPTVLVSFNGTNGASPGSGSIIFDAAGNLFGTTQSGGANNAGAVFEIAKTANGYSSTPTVLVSFNGTNGSTPYGNLIMDAHGDLLGTTWHGGANGYGVIYEVVKTSTGYSSTPVVLTSFNGTNANGSTGALLMDGAGNLFGTSPGNTVFELPVASATAVPTVNSTTTVINTDPAIAPTVTITSAAEASNVAAQTITGTVTAGSGAIVGQTVTLTDNGTTLGTAIVQADGSFSATVTLPNQGANSIVATVTDSLGSTGTSAAVVDTLDNIAPTVTITSAAEASNVAAQTITGTVSLDGAAAVVGQTVTVTDNGTTLGTAIVQADGSFSVGVVLPNQGANSIVATVSDSYGNTGTSAAVVDTLDNIAPTVTITSAAEASNVAAQTITGTVSLDGAAAVVGQTVTVTDNGTTLGTAIVQADGSFSVGVVLPNQGANSIVATVSDSYGNTGTSAAVVDTLGNVVSVAPTIIGTTAGQTTTSEAAVHPFSGVTIDDANVGATDTLTITLSGAGGTLSGAGLSGSGNTYTLSGSAATITSQLQALTFTPAAGSPNSSQTTTFTLSDVSSAYTNVVYASTATAVATFNGTTNGNALYGNLIADSAGNLFGTTQSGGANNAGTVFEIVKNGSGYNSTPVTLVSFNGTNGSSLQNSLLMDAAGNLFGTTETGGAYGKGTIFEIVKNGSSYSSTPVVLASFDGTNGNRPPDNLIMDASGNLFGMTYSGGANGGGTVFELVKTGSTYSSTPTTLVSFDSTSGINPAGSLSVDAAGNLYGTTTHGGANNVGTVFEIAKTANGYSSTPTVLVSFNGTNGASPGSGSIIFDAAGNLFGTTQSGGANNAGAVFEIAKTANGYSSTPTVLVSFNGTNGSTPYGNLIMDAHGDLLGTTWHGGANGYGVIYEVVKTSTGYSSTPVVLTSFNGTNANGSTGALLMDGAGNLFGTSPGNTVFELPVASATAVPTVNSTTTVINTDPAIAPTVTITSAAEASNVAAQTITGTVTAGSGAIVGQTVTLTDNGTTLGTAIVQADGSFSATVTLPNQGANSIVATVTDSLGSTGTSAAVVDTLDNIAPTVTITSAAEASNVAAQTITGTVSLDGAAAVVGQTVTVTDNGTTLGTAIVQADGSFSVGVVLPNQGANSIVATVSDSYGNTGTSAAVVDTLGNVVSVAPTIIGTTAGQTTTSEAAVHPFSGVTIDDANVGATDTLTITLSGAGGTLSGAGLSGSGNTYTLSGSAATITSQLQALTFTPAAGSPNSSQTTTFTLSDVSSAYTNVVYASTATAVATFNGTTNGNALYGNLIADSAGNLFGTTQSGGANNAGTVFEIVKNGSGYNSTPVTLVSFNGTNGSSLQNSLLMDAAGNLFGTTETGGAYGKGTIFEIVKNGSSYSSTPVVLASFDGTNGNRPPDNLIMDASGNLFGMTYSGGANGGGTVFELVKTGSTYSSTPTTLVSFDSTSGINPAGSLSVDAAGNLYGTTTHGGANNVGTVFEIAKTANGYSSTPTVLVSFNGTNGASPGSGSIIFDAAGNLFGTTQSGGANNAGAVFEIAKTANGYSSTPTVLVSFNGTNGSTPYGNLIMDAHGDLLGTTWHGGANGYGVIYEVVKTSTGYSSTPVVLTSFNGTNANGSTGALLMDGAGNLFGTSPGNTVFELPVASATAVPTVNSTTTVINTDPAIAPTVTITSAAEASNVAAQTITGTVTAGSGAIVGQTVTLTDNGTTLGTAIVQADGSFSATVTLPNQGANSIVATVTDSLGSTGTSAAVVDTLDNIAPTVTITSAPEPGNAGAQTISGLVASGGTATVTGQTVTLTDNGISLGTAIVQSNGSFSTSVTLPGQANNAIMASVTDSYGNTNNTYLVTTGSGQIEINAQKGTGTTNNLDFTGSVTDQNLWFLQSGNNLQIDILGTSTSATIDNWFSSSSPDQLQEIEAGGLKIDSQLSQLVQAMATYSSNNPGYDPASSGTSMPNDSNLQSAIAAAWHS
ncbi:choice-of-anchor tandem repeat GloVer-containing protein [Bradyrhizobium sp. SZCCHNRI1073]|uniref:choice-of-anchor tandem repeat GloVer-containing protein n=1 Tax=Bradyrhizobium sp. SZCCHNRI1073 TaxID=3057280 RepID=UPI002916E032|nr:choice-of-anchor tandem repeat GloVer-containing protein [Bradyrhizobium sp. SZCCHNRI1073]